MKDTIRFYYMMLRKVGLPRKDAATTARGYVKGDVSLHTLNDLLAHGG